MCGIVGYVGDKPCKDILLNGLRQLEYRGYDSAGIALLEGGKIVSSKAVGKVEQLVSKTKDLKTAASLGISHTRWATHGGVSVKNAHPHLDCKGNIAVVHNGIIENYAELKKELVTAGHTFHSETDTEVLAHLIEQNYDHELLSSVTESLKKVVGTYGIAVFHKNHPHEMVVARNGSPLVIGVGDGFCMVASDLSALIAHTDKVVYLHDGEVAVLEKDNFTISDLSLNNIHRDITRYEVVHKTTERGDYKHYMLKEIEEQPAVIEDTLRGRLDSEKGEVIFGGLAPLENELRKMKRIIMISCGTSYHAALVGKYMFEEYTNMEVSVEVASEFRYKKINADPSATLIVAISQSGETADTLAAVKEAKKHGFTTLGIVNVVGSTIAREVKAGIYTHAGFEIGVASTKAFTTQLTVLALLTVFMGRLQDMSYPQAGTILKHLEALPDLIRNSLSGQSKALRKIAQKYTSAKNFLYLGRKYHYPVALEGALKLKEISYIHAEGYPAGEMKHGPIAMIEPRFPSIVLAPKDEVYEKTVNAIEEIKARRGKIIAVVSRNDTAITKHADDVVAIDPTLPMLTPILSVIPLQLFAYHLADLLGRDIDKPRNLAKSVTVE